jgi:LuxR family maltose regulon positive regulatory protein
MDSSVSRSDSVATNSHPAGRSSSVVSRPHLLRALDQAGAARLTLIVAPAGYGKTTLLAEWLHGGARPGPALWHTPGEMDNDPAHLLQGLISGVHARFPDLTPAVDASSPLSYTLAQLFQQAAQAVGGPWRLVLDDYHLIVNPAIHHAFDTVLNLPAWPVHLVIASRSQPPLAAIARLRVEGRLSELDEADLRFTLDETQHFLAASGFSLEEAALRQVARRTEGWPAALRLVCQAAQREPRPDLVAILGRIGDERPLFDYLAGQVLDRQPLAVQTFLRRTALLPYLSTELCNTFLNINDASAILDDLERNHLFLSPLADRPGRCFRYHALFQDFLRRCLEQSEGAKVIKTWHRRAAACLLESPAIDDIAAAVDHLLAAQDWPAAADATEIVARRLDLGQFTRMDDWFRCLPSGEVSGRPRLLLALGLLKEGQGRWNEALAALAQAERIVLAGGESDEVARMRYQQARVHLRQGHYAQAQDLCQQALAYWLHAGAGHGARDLAQVYSLLGGCYSETDDLTRGEQCFQQALQLHRKAGDRLLEAATCSNIAGNIYVIQGRLAETIELGRQAQRIFGELGSYRVCYVLTALAMAYRLRGEYDAARAASERQLQLADAHQDRMMRGYALYSLGHLHRELGHRDVAQACYEEARLLGEELQEPFVLFEPHLGLALLALAEGDLREGRRHGQAARQHAQAVGNHYQEGLALTALGWIMHQDGDVPQAEAHWREALRLFQALGASFDLATICLYLADLCRREGRDGEACRHLGQAVDLSATYGYDFLFTRREAQRAVPLLVLALGQTLEVSEVSRLLVQIGQEAVEPLLALLTSAPDGCVRERVIRLLGEIGDERATPALSALRRDRHLKGTVAAALARIATAPRPPLRILALGGFQVQRGNQPIAPEAWQRRKTRLLLLYLLAQAPRRVPRDELLEALWPGLPPDSAALAFNTTFSDLRRILEPYLGKGQPSRYLLRDEETLALNPAAETWYDVAAFEQAVRAGGQAARQALELYRSDFLPEEPYVDWVLRERERLRGLYLNTFMAWLEEQVQAGAWREGVELARRILDLEPWLEEVWRALMTCLARLGRRSEALQAYQACARALRDELDAAPSAETQILYEELKT